MVAISSMWNKKWLRVPCGKPKTQISPYTQLPSKFVMETVKCHVNGRVGNPKLVGVQSCFLREMALAVCAQEISKVESGNGLLSLVFVGWVVFC
jgi:hypothetical protein